MTFLPSVRRSMGQGASLAGPAMAASLTDEELAARVMSPLARCSGSATDPDEWFPVAAVVPAARAEAQHALALCDACPVRAECLEMSLRQWHTIGKYGIWGGLVEAERAIAHREWLSGAPVTALLPPAAGEPGGSPEPVPAGAAEGGPIASLDSARRKPGRSAGGRPPGTRTRRRGPRAAGIRGPSLVEQ
jgi:WhiB family transcriptional regulator, redox-sensing transcriptional regulator